MAVNVSYLIVAGGGGGGGAANNATRTGGGGGGGGLKTGTTSVNPGTTYNIVVGAGGGGGAGGATAGTAGGDSSFNSITSTGGGGGGASDSNTTGGNGGSGGGGGRTGTKGTGTVGQGSDGGTGGTNAAGGGGSSVVGADGTGSAGGNGGAGTSSSINGTATLYGGGGGGGARVDTDTQGTGGTGGGGTGGKGSSGGAGGSINATNGTANTGGGGGGSASNSDGVKTGGSGGSGIVIISAPIGTINPNCQTTGNHFQSGGNDIWTFPADSTWTPDLYFIQPTAASYTLTTQTVNFSAALHFVVAQMSYTLTYVSALLRKAGAFANQTKNSATPTNVVKHTATLSNQRGGYFLVDSFTNTDFAGDWISYTPYTIESQSFTGKTGKLQASAFYLYRAGTVTGNIYSKLYTHTGTYGVSSVPDTLLATSQPVAIESLGITDRQLVEFQFIGSQQYDLVAGTNYCITYEFTGGDGANYLRGTVEPTTATHSGNLAEWNGSSWDTYHGSDMPFYVYANNSLTNQTQD